MTDVMDDSVSWEQRREMRRKKRQELLAEADRLVKKTDDVSNTTSRYSREKQNDDDDDEFEKERQRRRREREERRKREREELEKQLKDEEESRLEREKRREERRRLREESEREISEPPSSYRATVITKETEIHDEYNGKDETMVVTTTEVVEEYTVENGDYDQNQEEEAKEEEQEEEEEPQEEEEEDEVEQPQEEIEDGDYRNGNQDEEEAEMDEPEEEPEEVKQTYTSSVTTVTVTSKITNEPVEDEVDEVRQKIDELKLKRQASEKKRYERYDDKDEEQEEDYDEKKKRLEERRRIREQKRLEEEQREKEEAAKREAEYQEKLRVEREEREKRRADAEEKRKEYRKKLSQSEEQDTPLSPKSLAAPLVSKKIVSGSSADSDSSVASHLSNSENIKTDKKVKGDMEAKANSVGRPPAVPRRTQSTKIKLSDYRPTRALKITDSSEDDNISFQPTRPLNRKNRTRRSLDQMEQQADDLYDFLSELEHKKATCKESDLLNFLDSPSDRVNKPLSNLSPRTKRASIKDRAKLFADIKEEHGEHATTTKSVSNGSKSLNAIDINQISVTTSITKEKPRLQTKPQLSLSPSRQHANRNVNNNRAVHYEKKDIVLEATNVGKENDKSSEHVARKSADDEDISIVVHEEKVTVTQEAHSDVTNQDVRKEITLSKVEIELHDKKRHRRQKPNIPGKPEHLKSKEDKNQLTTSDEACTENVKARTEDVMQEKHSNAQVHNKSSTYDNDDLKVLGKSGKQTHTDLDSTKSSDLKVSEKSICKRASKPLSEIDTDPSLALSSADHKSITSLQNEDSSDDGDQDESERVEQLNKHIQHETPKTIKADINVAKAEGLDSRLEKYTKQASKHERKTSSSSMKTPVGSDVSDRRSKWERGEVHSAEKSYKKPHVVGAGGISSRKNLWETGKVGGASPKSTKEVADVHGAGFSSRKDLWLKASQRGSSAKKTESPVGIKTGVMNRLNKWEQGAVSGASHDKPKTKAEVIPAAGVGNRRAKFENIADSPKTTTTKQPIKLAASGVSDRKQRYESKAGGKQEDDRPLSSASDRDGSYDGRRSYDDDSGSYGRGQYSSDEE